MAKALAEATAKSPSWTVAVARGKIRNQASPPTKRKARGKCMSSSGTLPLFSSSLSSQGRRVARGKMQDARGSLPNDKSNKKAKLVLSPSSSSTSSFSASYSET